MSEPNVTQTSSHHIRLRGRSFPVLTLEPDAPLPGWIEKLDACLERSPAFFARKSIVIDVSRLSLEPSGIAELVDNLSERGIRIMGLTGTEPSWASETLPPILSGGRMVAGADEPKSGSSADSGALTSNEQAAFDEISRTLGSAGGGDASDGSARDLSSEPKAAASLVLEAPVRSGQSIVFPEGDVTVIGSVASGADLFAGGSVHVYGTIRGRVMAGAYGGTNAHIFCRRLEAELLAVGGIYMTADEIRDDLRGQAIHAWLEDDTLKIAKLD
jgi:septum site-determining protein MinC